MNGSNVHRSSYQCYPYLTKEEFAEVCHYLDRRYCRATLGPLRKLWRLHVHTALNLDPDNGPGCSTFLQITRPLDDGTSTDLVAKLGDFSLGGDEDFSMELNVDDGVVEMEDSDKEVLSRLRSRANFQTPNVKYEIHLHPTYRAPCLWFSLHNLPPGESAFDVETVFRHLVPEQFKDSLRRIGPIGGISIDHHPMTGIPSFFVHPCVLGEAMTGFDCSKEDYLMVWLGLVGGCVGLWVPREMATEVG
ncbi:uncharacterized protein F4822DRAFT_445133 [Hypoxylon trugodes]|uniref:uncharacterized protein n=1 Tax=Hypoxylon trugodes TaxID=326681 RepID=UPI0021A03C1D|nr:uncharacterized protein F4822DRAFT_445133 [Hypoxylon trugodes]KAI1387054.1 hypothetical protein F4822DRAFT_445133 [Hypoxylon trugodes]